MFIDTHCHLDFPEFDCDRDEVIRRSRDQGIDYLVNIGSSLQSSARCLELAQRHEYIYATIGIHPHDADQFKTQDLATLRNLAKNKKVVAIGEIGLDFYRNFSGADNQKALFIGLINLSRDLGLPLVIHSRQAEEESLRILQENLPVRAVVHCFSGGEDFLKKCLQMGFFISFTCNITYKKAQGLRSLIEQIPPERIFLETDCPYLAPEGLRGKRNEPQNVKYVADEIAKIKRMTPQEVGRITSENARSFFNF